MLKPTQFRAGHLKRTDVAVFSHSQTSCDGNLGFTKIASSASAARRHINWQLGVVYTWIVIVSLVSIRPIFPLYELFFMREASSILFLIVVAVGFRYRRFHILFILVYISSIYALIVVIRSDHYSFTTQIRLFANVIMFSLLIAAVPIAVRNIRQARKLLLFVLIWNGLLSLSAPLQGIIGPISWLYSVDNWFLLHGRGGFMRYLSLFGDPNVGGMVAALLPLILLLLPRNAIRTRGATFLLELFTWATSFSVVAYSLSFTSLILLSFTTAVTFWFSDVKRFSRIMQIGGVFVLGLFLAPQVYDMIEAILRRAGEPVGSISLMTAPDNGFIEGNIAFRLFSGLDINNSIETMLFGSTYNAVTISRSLNEEALLAHNGYKEAFIAGGLVGIVLLLVIVGWTFQKAYRLFRHRQSLPDTLASVSLVSVVVFVSLTFVMMGFPLQRYNGIGIIFWTAAGMIHALHDNLARPQLYILGKALRR